MSNQAGEDELEKQIESITQAMFVTLSEWQAGVAIDWHSAKVKGRADLLALLRTEKLKLLAEVRERVVGEDESPESIPPTMSAEYHNYVHAQNKLRDEQRYSLTKLEAEL